MPTMALSAEDKALQKAWAKEKAKLEKTKKPLSPFMQRVGKGVGKALDFAKDGVFTQKTLSLLVQMMWVDKVKKAGLLKDGDFNAPRDVPVEGGKSGVDGTFSVGKWGMTQTTLGVYRAVEHIDNPRGIGDAQYKSPDFDDICCEYNCERIRVDPEKKWKRYFAQSLDYIRHELDLSWQARKKSKSDASSAVQWQWEANRRFGQAMHTVEDLFAHSNVIELIIRDVLHDIVGMQAGADLSVLQQLQADREAEVTALEKSQKEALDAARAHCNQYQAFARSEPDPEAKQQAKKEAQRCLETIPVLMKEQQRVRGELVTHYKHQLADVKKELSLANGGGENVLGKKAHRRASRRLKKWGVPLRTGGKNGGAGGKGYTVESIITKAVEALRINNIGGPVPFTGWDQRNGGFYPLVTGTFGALDTMASVLGIIAGGKFKAKQSQAERTFYGFTPQTKAQKEAAAGKKVSALSCPGFMANRFKLRKNYGSLLGLPGKAGLLLSMDFLTMLTNQNVYGKKQIKSSLKRYEAIYNNFVKNIADVVNDRSTGWHSLMLGYCTFVEELKKFAAHIVEMFSLEFITKIFQAAFAWLGEVFKHLSEDILKYTQKLIKGYQFAGQIDYTVAGEKAATGGGEGAKRYNEYLDNLAKETGLKTRADVVDYVLSNPTHTLLSKDKNDHPLHIIAASTAGMVVQRIFNQWSVGRITKAKKEVSTYFAHPSQWPSGDKDCVYNAVRRWVVDELHRPNLGAIRPISDDGQMVQGALREIRKVSKQAARAATFVASGLDMVLNALDSVISQQYSVFRMDVFLPIPYLPPQFFQLQLGIHGHARKTSTRNVARNYAVVWDKKSVKPYMYEAQASFRLGVRVSISIGPVSAGASVFGIVRGTLRSLTAKNMAIAKASSTMMSTTYNYIILQYVQKAAEALKVAKKETKAFLHTVKLGLEDLTNFRQLKENEFKFLVNSHSSCYLTTREKIQTFAAEHWPKDNNLIKSDFLLHFLKYTQMELASFMRADACAPALFKSTIGKGRAWLHDLFDEPSRDILGYSAINMPYMKAAWHACAFLDYKTPNSGHAQYWNILWRKVVTRKFLEFSSGREQYLKSKVSTNWINVKTGSREECAVALGVAGNMDFVVLVQTIYRIIASHPRLRKQAEAMDFGPHFFNKIKFSDFNILNDKESDLPQYAGMTLTKKEMQTMIWNTMEPWEKLVKPLSPGNCAKQYCGQSDIAKSFGEYSDKAVKKVFGSVERWLSDLEKKTRAAIRDNGLDVRAELEFGWGANAYFTWRTQASKMAMAMGPTITVDYQSFSGDSVMIYHKTPDKVQHRTSDTHEATIDLTFPIKAKSVQALRAKATFVQKVIAGDDVAKDNLAMYGSSKITRQTITMEIAITSPALVRKLQKVATHVTVPEFKNFVRGLSLRLRMAAYKMKSERFMSSEGEGVASIKSKLQSIGEHLKGIRDDYRKWREAVKKAKAKADSSPRKELVITVQFDCYINQDPGIDGTAADTFHVNLNSSRVGLGFRSTYRAQTPSIGPGMKLHTERGENAMLPLSFFIAQNSMPVNPRGDYVWKEMQHDKLPQDKIDPSSQRKDYTFNADEEEDEEEESVFSRILGAKYTAIAHARDDDE
eukprot:TRINITY_DN923_c0_g1_i1.p1 TRINITY_DN923_c0_g1~~TRINITY_DN923_c0_g1_i1.p1  ORF type:complete len:1616 (+),score=482.18 TRINITY_DN923_c0_g1_i1:731-5578(+)